MIFPLTQPISLWDSSDDQVVRLGEEGPGRPCGEADGRAEVHSKKQAAQYLNQHR
jgi:hypothetical protein